MSTQPIQKDDVGKLPSPEANLKKFLDLRNFRTAKVVADLLSKDSVRGVLTSQLIDALALCEKWPAEITSIQKLLDFSGKMADELIASPEVQRALERFIARYSPPMLEQFNEACKVVATFRGGSSHIRPDMDQVLLRLYESTLTVRGNPASVESLRRATSYIRRLSPANVNNPTIAAKAEEYFLKIPVESPSQKAHEKLERLGSLITVATETALLSSPNVINHLAKEFSDYFSNTRPEAGSVPYIERFPESLRGELYTKAMLSYAKHAPTSGLDFVLAATNPTELEKAAYHTLILEICKKLSDPSISLTHRIEKLMRTANLLDASKSALFDGLLRVESGSRYLAHIAIRAAEPNLALELSKNSFFREGLIADTKEELASIPKSLEQSGYYPSDYLRYAESREEICPALRDAYTSDPEFMVLAQAVRKAIKRYYQTHPSYQRSHGGRPQNGDLTEGDHKYLDRFPKPPTLRERLFGK